MWSLRVLSGPQAGQIFNLEIGKNLVGRSSQCNIKISTPGVSKEHCEISVTKEKIYVVDLNSSNGTYVNGTKIQRAEVRVGEKFALHNIFVDIVPYVHNKNHAQTGARSSHQSTSHQSMQGNTAAQIHFQNQTQGQMLNQLQDLQSLQTEESFKIPQPHLNLVNNQKFQEKKSNLDLMSFKEKIQEYLDRVVLPSVYKLAQTFDFKYVLAGFVGLYIFVVTFLSLFPMITVTRDSIQGEAKKRAMSLAHALAETNKRAVAENNGTSLNTFAIEREEGVKDAVIVNRNDGTIMAPISRSGRSLDISFINEALRTGRDVVKSIDFTTIGAAFPIDKFDLDRQESVPIAYAVVIYDISALAFDEGIVISLFMQNLIIACVVGGMLFFFLYKLIEFPIASLNRQLDIAMREKNEHIENTFLFPPLQALTGNISSLITRYLNGDNQQATGSQGRDFEVSLMLQHFRDPAVAVLPNKKIIAMNSNFESLAQNSMDNLMSQGIDAIVDASLKLNFENLIQKSISLPTQIHEEELSMGRGNIIIRCHVIQENNNPAYFLFTVVPKKDDV